MATVTKPIILDETGIRIAEAIEALTEEVTMTVTCTATDSVSVTGQTIKVYDLVTGLVFHEFVYNGQPVSFAVPKGMSYRIVPTVTLAQHYCTDEPSGVASTNVSAALSFKSLSSIVTLLDLKAAVDAGNAKHIPIGWQVTVPITLTGESTHYFDVVDYEPNEDRLFLLMHDTLYEQKALGAPQALYRPTEAMAAGDYTFKVGSTSYYLTTTEDIPAGGQLRATTSGFTTYASRTAENALETGTVSTTAVSGATDLGTTGSGLLNHMDRVSYGSNTFGESALFQWLNGSGTDWWEPQTMFDRPPSYVSNPGFLSGIASDYLACLDAYDWKCFASSTYAAPDSSFPKGNRYTVNGRFCLASSMEVWNSDAGEGTHQWDAYVGATQAQHIKYYSGNSRHWWLRSPHSSANYECTVLSYGALNNNYAAYTYGVVPACTVSKSAI